MCRPGDNVCVDGPLNETNLETPFCGLRSKRSRRLHCPLDDRHYSDRISLSV